MIWIDLLMALFMFLFGLFFYNSHGKGASLLTGYNMRPENERKKYDEDAMCKSYGRRMLIMAVPFLVGAVIDYIYPGKGTILAWVLWIILFVGLLIDRIKREKQ